ncbi:GNAT family N-acetyltransferase [Clostridium sp. C2-6-12]|uniref:GNAT family N-acetyltransferase n=1 Tax=Clostridium sp. C2-6-12 TaxID=2698832 RepID=UPI001370B3B6|nr:GNAT family N-acetyltransferase [Clostridium sp. C2-6-12]
MKDYIIRNYCNDDADKIGSFDKVAELSYRYKGDFKPANIFCAVNSENEILGVADLEPHISWTPIEENSQNQDYIYRLCVNIRINPSYEAHKNLRSSLMDVILDRAKQIKKDYPGKKIRVIRYISADNNEEMDLFISKGFIAYRNSLVMKRDLTEEIKPCDSSPEFRIVNWKMETADEVKSYVETDAKCNDGAAWNFDTVSWMRYSPEWATFAAFSKDNEFLGGVMTYLITEERSATENIFVLPEWRRKGVAKAFITEALKYLKNNGKTMATLCTDGDNKPAINLYKSLGYRMYCVNIEFGYDV